MRIVYKIIEIERLQRPFQDRKVKKRSKRLYYLWKETRGGVRTIAIH